MLPDSTIVYFALAKTRQKRLYNREECLGVWGNRFVQNLIAIGRKRDGSPGLCTSLPLWASWTHFSGCLLCGPHVWKQWLDSNGPYSSDGRSCHFSFKSGNAFVSADKQNPPPFCVLPKSFKVLLCGKSRHAFAFLLITGEKTGLNAEMW